MVEPNETLVIDMTAEGVAEEEHEAIPNDVVVIAEDEEDDDPLPASAVLQPDGSVILTMLYPVVLKWKREGSDNVREDRHDTLHMRRLTGADVSAISAAGQGHAVMTGIAKSCRMQQGVFNQLYKKMDGADAAAAAQVFSFFLDAGARKANGRPRSR